MLLFINLLEFEGSNCLCNLSSCTQISKWSLFLCLGITSAKEVMFLLVFVCLSVCQQDNSKSYGRIFLTFWGHVGNGKIYQWFNFGGDTEGILDSGSLWNFRYHCFQWGIRETAAKPKIMCHLANNMALAEVCRLWLLSSLSVVKTLDNSQFNNSWA